MSYDEDVAWIVLFDNCKWKPVFYNLINFPTSSLKDNTVSITESYIVLMPIPETD